MRDGRILPRPSGDWLPWVAFGLIIAVAVHLLLLTTGKDITFYRDDWEFLLRRRGVSLDVFLRPHSDHLSAVPIAVYKAMLQVFGLNFRAFQWLLMAFLTGLGAIVYIYGRPRIGAWTALMPVIALMWGGSFWEDNLWTFQIGFIGSLACGVGAFVALDRQTTRGDVVACVLLLLSVAQASIGLLFVAGVTVELVLRRDWRRLWIVALPIVLYACWKLAYPETDVRRDNVHKTPHYVWEAAAGAFGSIFGLGRETGKLFMYACFGLFADALLRGRVNVRMWALIATALTFWAAAALARAQLDAPDVSRYLLPGATIVLLIVIEAARGLRAGRTAIFVLIALIPILYTRNKDVIGPGSGQIVTWSYFVQDDYKALELIRPFVSIDTHKWILDPQRAPDIDVASYYSLVDAFGNPAPSYDFIARTPQEARSNADAVMLTGTSTAPRPSSAPTAPTAPPQLLVKHWADAKPSGKCLLGYPAGGGDRPYIELGVPPEGIRYSAPGPLVTTGLRMFGDEIVSFGSPRPNAWFSVKPPPVKSPKPWLMRFEFGTTPVRICGGG